MGESRRRARAALVGIAALLAAPALAQEGSFARTERASPARASTRCASRSSATCTSTPASRPTRTSSGHAQRPGATPTLRARRERRARPATGRRAAARCALDAAARLRRGHRPLRVLRRGRLCSATPGSLGYESPTCISHALADGWRSRLLAVRNWLGAARRMPASPRRRASSAAARQPTATRAAVAVGGRSQAAAEESLRPHAGLPFTHASSATSTPASPVGREPAPQRHLPERARARAADQRLRHRSERTRRACGGGSRRSASTPAPAATRSSSRTTRTCAAGSAVRRSRRAPAEARAARELEPLVEIISTRATRSAASTARRRGVGTEDELCGFEQLRGVASDHARRQLEPPARRSTEYSARATWCATRSRTGSRSRRRSARTRSARLHRQHRHAQRDAPGDTDENGWDGGQGSDDAADARRSGQRRRTTPAASPWCGPRRTRATRSSRRCAGARPTPPAARGRLVRFFGGELLADVRCGGPTSSRAPTRSGTPMGGELGALRGAARPRFAVWRMKDPGSDGAPGTDLQRVQIVKGWVDADGADARAGLRRRRRRRTTAPASTRPPARRAARAPRELCAVWEDPDFDPRAARLLLRARAREPDLPLEHAALQGRRRGSLRAGLPRPGRRREPRSPRARRRGRRVRGLLHVGGRRAVLLAADPGARLDLPDLVSGVLQRDSRNTVTIGSNKKSRLVEETAK